MPLSTDDRVNQLSEQILQQFDIIFGLHPGFRPAHAKGLLARGTFTPAADAATLTRAPYVTAASTPVTVRFSNSTGIPVLPDNNPNAEPRGMAVRFHLGERKHSDIVSHSANGFPVRTGEEFLEFLKAIAATDPKVPADPANPSPVEKFVGSHPSALAFVKLPKPPPVSFAQLPYFGLTAFRFSNAEGATRFGRFRLVPVAGEAYADAATHAGRGATYLADELRERLKAGPVGFKVVVQLADAGDVVDDVTQQWPESRTIFELGTITLTETVPDDAEEQRHVILDPIPRVDGIEASADPLLDLRAAIYLISGRRRRAATVTSS